MMHRLFSTGMDGAAWSSREARLVWDVENPKAQDSLDDAQQNTPTENLIEPNSPQETVNNDDSANEQAQDASLRSQEINESVIPQMEQVMPQTEIDRRCLLQDSIVRQLYERMMAVRRQRYQTWLEMRRIEASGAADLTRIAMKTGRKWGMGSLPNAIAVGNLAAMGQRYWNLKNTVIPQLEAQNRSFTALYDGENARLQRMIRGDAEAYMSAPQSIEEAVARGGIDSSPGGGAPGFGPPTGMEGRNILQEQTEETTLDALTDPALKQKITTLLQHLREAEENSPARERIIGQLMMSGVADAESINPETEEHEIRIFKMGTFGFMLNVLAGMGHYFKSFGFGKRNETRRENASENSEATREELKGKIQKTTEEIKKLKETPDGEQEEARKIRESKLKEAKEALMKLQEQLVQKTWEEVRKKKEVLPQFMTGKDNPRGQAQFILEKFAEMLPAASSESCKKLLESNTGNEQLKGAVENLVQELANATLCVKDENGYFLQLKRPPTETDGSTDKYKIEEWNDFTTCIESLEALEKTVQS